MQEITSRFGSHFVTFLGTDAIAATCDSPAIPVSLDMPRAERSFIMEAIDNYRIEAVREGGRIAYLAIFGSPSWEEEKKRLSLLLRCECWEVGNDR